MRDTKQAEKQYLARTGSSTWERAKPFSPPGNDTLIDSAQLLHDFAIAMIVLQPSLDDLILDVGAGGCWCSDLLGRLNRRSIAVDISLDMLRAGRSRPTGGAIPAVAGDVESLPFTSKSFQKAVCISAIHHVPDIPRALKEISRVLSDDGVAMFSEPGRGHAEAAISTTAMRDFGVLEQDILISDFAQACSDAGFADVRIKPLAYAIPGFDVTVDQWHAWSRLADSKRPMRALQKIRRGCAEFLGLGKGGALFAEAFGMSLVRTLRRAIEDHPIIVASKAAPGIALMRGKWSAEINVESDETAMHGAFFPVRATAVNRGWAKWQTVTRSGTGHVKFGVQLLDAEERLVDRDFHRVSLPHDVAPGGEVTLMFDCPTPSNPGSYMLKFDLVAEGATWFEPTDSKTATRKLMIL